MKHDYIKMKNTHEKTEGINVRVTKEKRYRKIRNQKQRRQSNQREEDERKEIEETGRQNRQTDDGGEMSDRRKRLPTRETSEER
ncbi:hypothetical protein CHS0354_023238 [Potamilus streckersoni]|uniref:Uncharacterized protein n=1 Tax=Potamilus streckersoni TaxID=2493646 RepID=A0AAE0WAQ9_9BIVA|nr:hypothetical protein CHS0354_023238 [Potamilus streckersoni]